MLCTRENDNQVIKMNMWNPLLLQISKQWNSIDWGEWEENLTQENKHGCVLLYQWPTYPIYYSH